MESFSDIRPYNDNEVEEVIARIIANNEFIQTIGKLKFPNFPGFFQRRLSPLVRFMIRRQLRGVRTVKNFQEKIKLYVEAMVASSMTSLTFEGVEQLDPSQSYLFIANHRDIALDPAIMNYALHLSGLDTVRIAIGDNLLTKDYVSDLMRINKSFIVKRSIEAPRKLLAALKELSSYIHYSLKEDGQSVWIAQREGRAKDGLDKTDAAIIKMLVLSQRKQPFHEVIKSLNIIPVAVSYEYDPCDLQKAIELREVDRGRNYAKQQHEDIESIARGIAGFKGRVHLSFGQAMSDDFQDVGAVVEHLDKTILNLYKIPPSHFFAYEELFGELPSNMRLLDEYNLSSEALKKERAVFKAHFESVSEEYRAYLLWGYVNPLLEKLELGLPA